MATKKKAAKKAAPKKAAAKKAAPKKAAAKKAAPKKAAKKAAPKKAAKKAAPKNIIKVSRNSGDFFVKTLYQSQFQATGNITHLYVPSYVFCEGNFINQLFDFKNI